MPRPAVSRLAANLAEAGYLEYSPQRGQYRLGVSVLALGYAALANVDIFEAALPYLQELADSEDALLCCRRVMGWQWFATKSVTDAPC